MLESDGNLMSKFEKWSFYETREIWRQGLFRQIFPHAVLL